MIRNPFSIYGRPIEGRLDRRKDVFYKFLNDGRTNCWYGTSSASFRRKPSSAVGTNMKVMDELVNDTEETALPVNYINVKMAT